MKFSSSIWRGGDKGAWIRIRGLVGDLDTGEGNQTLVAGVVLLEPCVQKRVIGSVVNRGSSIKMGSGNKKD